MKLLRLLSIAAALVGSAFAQTAGVTKSLSSTTLNQITGDLVIGSGRTLNATGTGVITATGVPSTGITGTISNAQLANSSVTIGSTAVSLGGTAATIAGLTLTAPTLTSANLGTPTTLTLTNATGLPLTTGVTGTLPVANGGTGVTTSTGSGSNVLSNSPTLVTPNLGTPSAVSLTNATGLPLTTGVTGTLPVANGGTGTTTSTGSGSVVLSTSPALVTPNIGAATGTSLNLSSTATVNSPSGTSSGLLVKAFNSVGGNVQYWADFQTSGGLTLARFLRGNGAAGYDANGLSIDSYQGLRVNLNALGGSGGTFTVAGGDLAATSTTASTSTTTGALTVAGGAGIGGSIYAAGGINSASYLVVDGSSSTGTTKLYINNPAGQVGDIARFLVNGTDVAKITATGGATFSDSIIGPTLAPGFNTPVHYFSAFGASGSWPTRFSTVYDANYVDQYITLNGTLTGTRGSPTFTGSGGGGGYIRAWGPGGVLSLGTFGSGTGTAPVLAATFTAGNTSLAGNLTVSGTGGITATGGNIISGGNWFQSSNNAGLLSNLYFSSGWKYVGNGAGAAIYADSSNGAILATAAVNSSGAGAAATLTTALTLAGANATIAGNLTVSGGTTTLADSNGSFGTLTGSYNAGNQFVRLNRIGATESIGLYADNSTRFVNNSVETARLTSGGYLGVNRTSPVTRLHVYDSATAPSLSADTGIATFGSSSTVQLAFGAIPTSPYGAWLQTKTSSNDGNSWPLSINPLGGNVLVGTTSDVGTKLWVQGAAGFSGYVYAAGNNQLAYPNSGYGQAAIGWNFSGGNAEVNFWNNYIGGTPGDSFQWLQKTGASSASALMALTSAGTLTVLNNLNVTGGTIGGVQTILGPGGSNVGITSGSGRSILLNTNGGTTAMTLTSAQQVQVNASTASTSTTTGALVVSGGVGVGGVLNVGSNLIGSSNLLLGVTTPAGGLQNADHLSYLPGNKALYLGHLNGTTDGTTFVGLGYNGTFIGSITQNGTTGVLYNTTSDARLKTNVRDVTNSGAIIDALKPRVFDWKNSPDRDRYGFLAQEVYAVFPQAVKKGDDGAEITDAWAMDAAKLVPVLVAEIKALRARVQALEAK